MDSRVKAGCLLVQGPEPPARARACAHLHGRRYPQRTDTHRAQTATGDGYPQGMDTQGRHPAGDPHRAPGREGRWGHRIGEDQSWSPQNPGCGYRARFGWGGGGAGGL